MSNPVSQQVDVMLDEIAHLMFGQPYDRLNPKSADKCIAEACCRFNSNLVDCADSQEAT
jgi:hypothetical protein